MFRYLGDQIKEDEISGRVAHMSVNGNILRVLVGKLEEGDCLEDCV
jgi:hypothetical protein